MELSKKPKFEVGDTIKCANSEECVELMMSFEKEGYKTDFLYEKNGIKGLWIVIKGIEDGTDKPI